jgi:hypothetical protein
MVNNTGRPVSQHIQDAVAQSPIRGALQAADIETLNDVYRGLSVERAVRRFKANRDARHVETNAAMLDAFRELAEHVESRQQQGGVPPSNN